MSRVTSWAPFDTTTSSKACAGTPVSTGTWYFLCTIRYAVAPNSVAKLNLNRTAAQPHFEDASHIHPALQREYAFTRESQPEPHRTQHTHEMLCHVM